MLKTDRPVSTASVESHASVDLSSPSNTDDVLRRELLYTPLSQLMKRAGDIAVDAFGSVLTYSPKVFIPTTKLCRNVCHYCTFAQTPKKLDTPYLSVDEMLAIANEGRKAGCLEALFTLGDKPESRYRVAAEWLRDSGYSSTVDYVADAAKHVHRDTGLLPHLNLGIASEDELVRLREVSGSMGLMLETVSDRLSKRGGPHFGSPDKEPSVRLAMIEAAGKLSIPFTTGILIGIGESRSERLDALFAIRDLHLRYDHIQEVIVQNFRAKADTKMATTPEPSLDEHLWSIAAARLILPETVSVQAPPNLQPSALRKLVEAGVNDWGGVSPVTVDHVNPEAAWPSLKNLADQSSGAGRTLVPRLTLGPRYARSPAKWCGTAMSKSVRRFSQASGLARTDDWYAGLSNDVPTLLSGRSTGQAFQDAMEMAEQEELDHRATTRLFAAQGDEICTIVELADKKRIEQVGDAVTYVVNQNINYANICLYSCGFCAFSKSRAGGGYRDTPYVLKLDEIAERAVDATNRGATEVCLQGGIHPDFNGDTYLSIVRTVREVAPQLHIHAFSPLEVTHGAQSLGKSLYEYLSLLADAGLKSLPGTAAEILDDTVREELSASKISVAGWSDVMRTAHAIGLKSTATIMFGHVDTHADWATHLLCLRTIQRETRGFTEFVPLPFVHQRAPIWVKGNARSGPGYSEALLMHAIARLALGPDFRNIQTSWTKMGLKCASQCLMAGANDLGGTLMRESITRAAGGMHGQEMTGNKLAEVAEQAGRPIYQRNTLYEQAMPV